MFTINRKDRNKILALAISNYLNFQYIMRKWQFVFRILIIIDVHFLQLTAFKRYNFAFV